MTFAASNADRFPQGDVTLLKQAMLHDPLTAAVCNPEEIWQMTDQMLVAQAQWLPQYKKQIAAAQKRLAGAKPLGTNKWKGAARLKEKSVAQLRKESAAIQNNFDAVKASAKRKK